MEVFIKIKFDKREVGAKINLSESVAKRLIVKGFVAIDNENGNEVKTVKTKKNEKVN